MISIVAVNANKQMAQSTRKYANNTNNSINLTPTNNKINCDGILTDDGMKWFKRF